MSHTPVALIIFNRPQTTERVFAEIARAKPKKLLIIGDGPRTDRPEDVEKCAAVRAIVERVDWQCEVLKNYSETNLGCGRRPATGISWVFEQVEQAIILEEDCVPHPTFFRFCDELLDRYREDERVMHIAGTNFLFGQKQTSHSYFFSHHNTCWGWATWRRAWQHFDMALKLWPKLRDTSWLLDIVGDVRAKEFWEKVFVRAHARNGDVDYWDYQWTFACWAQSGLSVLPTRTLVSNIGFGQDATHTKSTNAKRAFLFAEEMTFPLQHPPSVIRDHEADRLFIEQVVLANLPNKPGFYHRLRRKCSAVLVDYPCLKSPSSLFRRFRQSCAALTTGQLRNLISSLRRGT